MSAHPLAGRHTQQYFENFGNRAMYKDGWCLSIRMLRIPWRLDPELLKRFAPGVWDPDDDPVELYYLPDDFSQANDLAAGNPGKVKELQALFWEEAEKYNIGAAGALVGKFARHRVESGLEEKMGAALPPGSAGVVAIYDRSKAAAIDATLASAVRKSVAHVDGGGAKKLKAALADAQAGLGG